MSDALPDYGGMGVQPSEGGLGGIQSLKPGYMDLNFTIGNGIVGTGGVILDGSGGWHWYGGAGFGSSGFSLTISPNTLSTGWNFGVQGGYYGLSGQVGYGGGSGFIEGGAGWPGFSGTAYYIGD